MPTVMLLGATSDIAIQIAKQFASEKYDLFLAGRNVILLEKLAGVLQEQCKVAISVFFFDAVASHEQHIHFYRMLPRKPDITICIFGYLGIQEKAATDWNETSAIIQVNYVGAVSILNVVAEDYSKRGAGTIIGISSVAGERGRQRNYIYGSAKAGFTTYLSGLRNRLYSSGVHVITVLPGFVNTKMTAGMKMPAFLTASPEQVAVAVKNAFLKKRNVVYVKGVWRWIMGVIKHTPETLFKKKNL